VVQTGPDLTAFIRYYGLVRSSALGSARQSFAVRLSQCAQGLTSATAVLCSDSNGLRRIHNAVNRALSHRRRSESVERKRSNPPEGFNDLKSSLNTASRFQCVRFRPALHAKPESRHTSRYVNDGRTIGGTMALSREHTRGFSIALVHVRETQCACRDSIVRRRMQHALLTKAVPNVY
jgi:hypothetical protein